MSLNGITEFDRNLRKVMDSDAFKNVISKQIWGMFNLWWCQAINC